MVINLSSYISFCIANKNNYELYSKKYDEIDSLEGYVWNKDYSEAYNLLGTYYELYYCSRSFQPYIVFSQEIGFHYKYKILTKDIISVVLESLNQDLEDIKDKLDYYKKYGTLHSVINSKTIKMGLDFIDSISNRINDYDQLENLKTILINVDIDDEDYEESISWYKEEYDNLKSSIELISSLCQFISYIDENSVIIYCFD